MPYKLEHIQPKPVMKN